MKSHFSCDSPHSIIAAGSTEKVQLLEQLEKPLHSWVPRWPDPASSLEWEHWLLCPMLYGSASLQLFSCKLVGSCWVNFPGKVDTSLQGTGNTLETWPWGPGDGVLA